MNQTLQRIGLWLIAVAVPVFLLITAIRVLFSPFFMQMEYRMPGFPTDVYGFTLEDRLHYARVSLDYLFNDQGIDFLARQQLPDGQPLYNERELSHMADVKLLFQRMIIAWTVLLVVLALLALWAWRGKWMRSFLHALGNGGKLTIALIVLTLVIVAISFRQLFTVFHQLFFTGDTWIFNFSDSLIRLFPIRLWQDSFIGVGLLTILEAALLIFIDWRVRKSQHA